MTSSLTSFLYLKAVIGTNLMLLLSHSIMGKQRTVRPKDFSCHNLTRRLLIFDVSPGYHHYHELSIMTIRNSIIN